MKIFTVLMLAAIFLVSCDRLEGQLNITKDLKLVSSKGATHLLRVGTYSADLRQSTFGKKIVLRLNNNVEEKYNFLIPPETRIPENGTFNLTSNQIGQNVDLTGTVRTAHSDSSMQDTYQSCTYTEQYTQCLPTGPNGQVICQTYYRTVYGTQWIRFFDRVTTQDIHLSIAQAGSDEESAQFVGGGSFAQRIIVNQSPCR